MYTKPLIIHGNGYIYLLNALDPDGMLAQKLVSFCNLIKSPEGVSTFEITPFSIWFAAAKGISCKEILATLEQNAVNQLDKNLKSIIETSAVEFNTLDLHNNGGILELTAKDQSKLNVISADSKISRMLLDKTKNPLRFAASNRILLKIRLFELKYFVIDHANVIGDQLDLNLRSHTVTGDAIELRDYQEDAFQQYIGSHQKVGGGGTIVMPPYSGKTLVALKIIQQLKLCTLIIAENHQSLLRWEEELLDKTDLAPESFSILNEQPHSLKPITLCTYQTASALLDHLETANWGLIIYDDAHKLPASFNVAGISSRYKLALAATLARGDDQGLHVLYIIGPKWYEILPKTLEWKGYQPPIKCVEFKIPFVESQYELYEIENNPTGRLHQASLNKNKETVLDIIIDKTYKAFGKRINLVSYFLDVAEDIVTKHDIPIISGKTNDKKTKSIIQRFNNNEIPILYSSTKAEKANLKNIDILVNLSFFHTSEREEYLRLGKLMNNRLHRDCLYYFSLVTTGTDEETAYKQRRQQLVNMGYRYHIILFDEVAERMNDILESEGLSK